MSREKLIGQTADYVQEQLLDEGSGHDWWHIYRVWNNAKLILKHEMHADAFVVELAALLHDIADHKFHNGDTTIGPSVAGQWLEKLFVPEQIVMHVQEIIRDLSFKGARVKTPMHTLEGMIVQDADRLDAIGAIGIARTFAYGGHAGQLIYDPGLSPTLHESFEDYQSQKTSTINHFYEKLLLLKDRMNTETAKHIAALRHQYMEDFLNQFYQEWEGKA